MVLTVFSIYDSLAPSTQEQTRHKVKQFLAKLRLCHTVCFVFFFFPSLFPLSEAQELHGEESPQGP